MKVIWKYKITGPIAEFDGPAGAEPLCVKVQAGEPVMYLLCERGAPSAKHSVTLVGTSQGFDESAGNYVGTLLMQSDKVVLHVFHKQLSVELAS